MTGKRLVKPLKIAKERVFRMNRLTSAIEKLTDGVSL
jgi:hypothetical protein